MSLKYIVCRADRSTEEVAVGETLYSVGCDYGVANEDSRYTGIEHISLSKNENGMPGFTIPVADVLQLAETK